MDLVAINPIFDLYNYEWPILTGNYPHPPAKFVHEAGARRGRALSSLVAPGAIVSGSIVRRSILSARVRVNSFAEVEDSVLFDNVDIGRNAIVRRAVIDKNVRIPDGDQIGVDLERDRERFTVSDSGCGGDREGNATGVDGDVAWAITIYLTSADSLHKAAYDRARQQNRRSVMQGTLGEIRLFGGYFEPDNWRFCNGTELKISDHTQLFSLLGTTYGGDGRTTFALPNLEGRIAIGVGAGEGLRERRLV